MSRSVVRESAPRCERCRYAHRWCICEGFEAVACPLQVDVLIHHREFWRPTSTGRLINRVMPASRGHVFRHDLPLNRAAIVQPGRTLWILHPLGEALPAETAPADLQVLLFDGSWREAARMMHGAESWGRLVSLPLPGPSRYLLRDQQGAGKHSTIEALLGLLAALGLAEEHRRLQLQFELHVYAGLRARGEKAAAEKFLEDSPVRDAFPKLLATLNQRISREAAKNAKA
ncbi:MAG TPA: DTW domain-containing protein [Opitutaceae bacterium]|nr:DTW domain-containing protein [Opitutaceae bacterium]HWB97787.1 DTW domain-containing protein [Bryobacteraceae bacterium]